MLLADSSRSPRQLLLFYILKNELGQRQFSAQAPGPPGWPHEPHAPAATGSASAVDPAVAKTDSFFSRSVERQLGQSGTVLERTSISNS
jgi:hypothetical protein